MKITVSKQKIKNNKSLIFDLYELSNIKNKYFNKRNYFINIVMKSTYFFKK